MSLFKRFSMWSLPLAIALGQSASGAVPERDLAPDKPCGPGGFEEIAGSETHRFDAGEHWFCLREPAELDLEMASAGGGGGGASDTHDSWGATGNGGGAGHYLFKRYKLPRGSYLLVVGKPGSGGQSLGRTIHASSGGDGGYTMLAYRSGLPIETLKGGKGGAADGNPGGSASKGADGESLTNPTTGAKIGTGGLGGIWMTSGGSASDLGAGGGGSGGTRLPGIRGGDGSPGFAKITRIGGR